MASKKKTDRRRKVTPFMAMNMSRMLNAKNNPKTLSYVANHFGVSPYAVRYNTDEAFRQAEIVRVNSY